MKYKKTRARKTLKKKFAQSFDEDINTLSTGMQAILIDDLVTAFESRLLVLSSAQSEVNSEVQSCIDFGVEISNETF